MSEESDAVERWGGELWTVTRGVHTRQIYLPPERVVDGPLDYYITGGPTHHFIHGPLYRDAMTDVWGPKQPPEIRPEVSSICGKCDVKIAADDGVTHYLETLGTTGFTDPDPVPHDIHERHLEVSHGMVSGAPLTVLGTACGNCSNIYRRVHLLDEVMDAVEVLTEKEIPEYATNGGDDEWDPEPAELREGEERDMDSHARRNLETIRALERELDGDGDD